MAESAFCALSFFSWLIDVPLSPFTFSVSPEGFFLPLQLDGPFFLAPDLRAALRSLRAKPRFFFSGALLGQVPVLFPPFFLSTRLATGLSISFRTVAANPELIAPGRMKKGAADAEVLSFVVPFNETTKLPSPPVSARREPFPPFYGFSRFWPSGILPSPNFLNGSAGYRVFLRGQTSSFSSRMLSPLLRPFFQRPTVKSHYTSGGPKGFLNLYFFPFAPRRRESLFSLQRSRKKLSVFPPPWSPKVRKIFSPFFSRSPRVLTQRPDFFFLSRGLLLFFSS